MELSKNIIAVIDNLAEKFGITIDWSQENIMPYLMDLFERWQKYNIAVNIMWIIVELFLIGITIWFICLIGKDRNRILKLEKDKRKDTTFFEIYFDGTLSLKFIPMLVLTLMLITAGLCIASFLHNINSLIGTIYMPEIEFYKEFINQNQ